MNQHNAVGSVPLRIVKEEEKRLEPSNEVIPFDIVWPIGSIFVGAVSTNPSLLLYGGTWTSIQSGVWVSIGDIDLYIWRRTG